MVGVVLATLLIVGFGLSRVLGGVTGEPVATCDLPIAWQDAGEVVGEASAIVGPVAAASYEPEVGGRPTFVNLGNAYPDPDRFDVVIYEDVRTRFADPPEALLPGEHVCVRGRVRDRDGVPQIVLEGPGWISIEPAPPSP